MMMASSAAAWNSMLDELRNDEAMAPMLPFATAAAADKTLKGLYPYASHMALGFSRKPVYPFTRGLPFVTASKATFSVWTQQHRLLGSGSVEEALRLVKRHLRTARGSHRGGSAVSSAPAKAVSTSCK